MNRPDLDVLLQTLREIFPQLSPEDQVELFRTVQELKVQAAEREANKIKDPDMRMWAQGFAKLEREALEGSAPSTLSLPSPKPNHEQ